MRILMLIVALGLLAAPVNAAGGGGGGGISSAPSTSGPQYDAVAEYLKGVSALQAKNFKAAKSAFDHALTVSPRDANTQYLAGVARTGLGDLKGARKFYARATKLDAKMIVAWRDLGVTDGQLGDKANAQEALVAIEAQRNACAETCPQAVALKEADEAVAAAVSGVPTGAAVPTAGAEPGALLFASSGFADSKYMAAVALINDRNYEQAIEALKSAQRAFGAHPDILTYLGFANRKLGRFDIAEGYYKAALAAAPGHRGATEYFGELMVERRNMAGARRMLARLDAQCRFGCTEAEELRAWISVGHSPHSS